MLVNNAGTTHFIPHADLDALTDGVWDDIFQVNLKGAFYAARAAMPLLRRAQGQRRERDERGGPSGQGSSIPYCASKAALNCADAVAGPGVRRRTCG